MYQTVRKILFAFDPESVHYFAMDSLRIACKIPLLKSTLHRSFSVKDEGLKKDVFGLTFKNPVGLAAGFDKNAMYLDELEILGFGSVEIGTVTPLAQPGNDKPRLFRLPEDKAIINRMGFNNDGVKAVARRVKEWRERREKKPTKNQVSHDDIPLIIGGNIGKNKITPNEEAWKDYEKCFNELFPCVDYFVVNVSSPNTPGLRELQEKDSLRRILSHLQTINHRHSSKRPLLLKIAPDLTQSQLDDIIDLAEEIKLDGVVATNTTIAREPLTANSKRKSDTIGAGGLSGKPLMERSTEVVKYIAHQSEGKIPIIASGGIFTAEDAQEKLKAGASLIQVWSGFIYEGPGIAKKICTGLKRLN
ncbi:MAG TPA: quinone-dependent dihydroorotate dehydrogenase [Parasegetibacter sp.]|jgi:dihydroorotate dehydrogenase